MSRAGDRSTDVVGNAQALEKARNVEDKLGRQGHGVSGALRDRR